MAAETYEINGVTLPLEKWPNGGRAYGRNQCWAFATMVYKTLWGRKENNAGGTENDLLRCVGTGSARAITAENTRRFIEMSPLGSHIRLSQVINGSDSRSRQKHSQILIQKDENGFTVYESINPGIRIIYRTWAEYANHHKRYKYFKYIKYPVSNESKEQTEEEFAPLGAETSVSTHRLVDFESWCNQLLVGKDLPVVLQTDSLSVNI